MATLKWKGTAGKGFDTAGNWSGAHNAVPGAGDVALIALAGSSTVTAADNITVRALGMVASATLDITAGTFTILAGSAGKGLAGTIKVEDGATLSLAGVVVNTGTIALGSVGGNTDLIARGVSVTLTGGGHITLSNSGGNRIYGSTSAHTLINLDNTISGAGQLGNGQMTFSNGAKGIVDANAPSHLVLYTNNEIATNAGLLESTGGGLDIVSTAVVNTGRIAATGGGAVVNLNNSSIEGGTLATSGGGVIQTTGGYTSLDGLTNGALTNTGSMLVNDGTTLHLDGVITNTGTIFVSAASYNTDIIIDSQSVTLGGGGHVILGNNGANRIYGSGGTRALINLDNTIAGAGQLGDGQMTFTNGARGIVDANAATTLVLNTNNAVAINNGLLEATATGGLGIVATTVLNSGRISAAGSGSAVNLSSSTIEGGTLASSSGGVIQTIGGNSALDGRTNGALTNTGVVRVNDGTALHLAGAIVNIGTINVAASSNDTDIVIDSQVVVLSGAGQLLLSNNGVNRIYGATAANTLVNVNNTISGAGQLGDGRMTFTNRAKGVVNANAATQLVLNTGSQIVENDGLLEATGSGGLGIVGTTVLNHGRILATAAVVTLSNSSIEGGTLATSGGGVILTIGGNNALDGRTNGVLTVAGLVRVGDGTALHLDGIINNTGTITATALSNDTDLVLDSQSVTLTGGGLVLLGNNADNRIYGGAGTNVLVNINNTIEGAGLLGNGQMAFSNGARGVVDANAAIALLLDTNNAIAVNAGVMEASGGGGGLGIDSTVVLNSGRISAIGAGAQVSLTNSRIEGGNLTTSGGGVIQTTGGYDVLDGTTNGALTNTGTVRVNAGTTLHLAGHITNTGTIQQSQNSAGGSTDIVLDSQTVTLSGRGGMWIMSANSGNRIYGAVADDTLVNTGNTISGVGLLGNGQMTFVNGVGGVVDANAPSGAIVIALGGQMLTNAGELRASGFGGLVLDNLILRNDTGTLKAGDDSSVVLRPNVDITNTDGGALTGGNWEAIAAGRGATLDITGGPVQTLAANIVLSGFGSMMGAWNGAAYQDISTSLTTIAAGGALQILGDRGYDTTLALTDHGNLVLGGNTLVAGGLTVAAHGVLRGFGTVRDAIVNAGTVAAAGGLLAVTGAIAGRGALTIGAGATLELGGATSETVTFGAGAAEMLRLDVPATFLGGFAGLRVGDTIDFAHATLAAAVVAGGKLSVQVNGTEHSFAAKGALAGNHFAIKSDNAGGQELVLTPGAALAGHGGGFAGFDTGASDPLAMVWHN